MNVHVTLVQYIMIVISPIGRLSTPLLSFLITRLYDIDIFRILWDLVCWYIMFCCTQSDLLDPRVAHPRSLLTTFQLKKKVYKKILPSQPHLNGCAFSTVSSLVDSRSDNHIR